MNRLVAILASAALVSLSSAQTVGVPAPELELNMVSGPREAKVDLASLRGNVVVLEYWATWCAPCVKAIPHLNELAAKFKGKPVRFVSASIEHDKPQAVADFLKQNRMDSWVGIASERMWKQRYGVTGVPETFIIDPKGKLVAITYPTEVTPKVIDDVLAGRAPRLRNFRSIPKVPARLPGAAPEEPVAELPADEPSLLLSVKQVPKRANASRFGPDGRWTIAGADTRTVISTIFDVSPARVVGGQSDAPKYFAMQTRFPGGMTMEEMLATAQRLVPPALGVRAWKEEKEIDVYALRRIADAAETARKVEAPGHAGRGPGFSSGSGAVISLLARSLEDDLKTPVFDETALKGYYDWNLNFTSGDATSATMGLRALGLELRKERRKVQIVMVEPMALGK